ncbi:hypothetical protein COCSUDRAFT_43570 [Coccomyxa subellipsoidea C-169]|uniref:Galactose oxidase n=1 Tax=Coccomyxa subellipsoidea (strain C-169) TaxID=574566 RepID=I0YSA2_COCSC|nr:hypothetical protein COCSUDRAFT_43570 [Coccomyxa subellipsoidea C-169]EIE21271.1 hypothetical protein COCSUDRAFT_43570 [Coccomyxa subellipsoidea C-169]|eukprot:XP_005645815.1 hypothetical protein COCSUDRAFT_43570 [Coccomyxa subellipsoidea C-169]
MEQARPASDLLVRPLTEREIALVEEIRLTGNQFFRKQQYRDAELLYRSGLGLMALGPEGLLTESAQGSEMRCIKMSPTDVCSRLSLEDNRRAATLFVNLGQCLLNVPGPSREATIAALDAVEICFRAEVHLNFIQLQRSHKRSTPTTNYLPPEDPLCSLVLKAIIRKGFDKGSLKVRGVPEGLGDMYTRAQRQQAIKHAPVVHRIRGHFSCGSVSNGAVFVVHFSSEQGAPAESYMVTQWRKNAQGGVCMSCWGLFSGEPMKPYLTGVVFKNCLYCLHLLGEDPHMFYCPLGPDGIGLQGTGLKVALEYSEDCSKMRKPVSVDDLGRLVACGDAMYLFGGIDILENGQSSAANDLYRFVLKYDQDGAISHAQCTKVISECPPSPRWAHATFVHGNQIFIYGGVDESKLAYNDMWSFDVETGQWSCVECFGCKPCARYAADVERAVLVGGCTNAGLPPSRKNCLWLADVWEFHFAEQCWIQVVPENRNQPWIAGQQSAACGLVGNDTLLAVGGYGPHRKPENDVLARFTFTSGPALALHASVAKQGRWRDLAVERACEAVAGLKPDLARMPENLQELYGAPAGSVTLLTSDVPGMAATVLTPSDKEMKEMMPPSCKFGPHPQEPLRPLGAHSVWGSEECPFDLAPRWLTSPSEVSVNLASARSGSLTDLLPFTLCQTVKVFGTVKV